MNPPVLLRLCHQPSQAYYICEVGLGLYGGVAAGERVGRRDGASGEVESPLMQAATHLCAHFDVRVPGLRFQADVVSLGCLNEVERAEFEGPEGTRALRLPVQEHLSFFDPQGSGWISWSDNYRGWRDLGFGVPKALFQTLGAAAIFGWPGGGRIEIGRLGRVRPSGSSGIYDAEGRVNQPLLEELLAALEAEAIRGTISRKTAWRCISRRFTLGRIPGRQFQSLFLVCSRVNGSDTVTLDQVRWLYDGSLLWKVAQSLGTRADKVRDSDLSSC